MRLVKCLMLLSLSSLLIGWTRPSLDEPVIVIDSGCYREDWDKRPCDTFHVQDGFNHVRKEMTAEEIEVLKESLFDLCPNGVSTSPVNPFAPYWPPHFEPRSWEVSCA